MGALDVGCAACECPLPVAALDEPMPGTPRLLGAAPNPFNPATTIRFVLPEAAMVRLTVYDTAGRRVAVLTDAAYSEGEHSVTWRGTGELERHLSGGLYLMRFETGRVSVTRKLILLK